MCWTWGDYTAGREMAQWLRVVAALPEDLSSIPSAHIAGDSAQLPVTTPAPEDLTLF